MSEVIDTLVTDLEFDADVKILDQANAKLKQLEKQSEKTADATNELADQQIKLKSKLADTEEKTQQLRREQAKLRDEIKSTKKPSQEQVQALKEIDQQLEQTTLDAQKFRNQQIKLKASIADTNEKTQQLRREQAKLRDEIKSTKKPSKEQVQALKKIDQQLGQTTLDTQKFRNELNQLGIAQAKLTEKRKRLRSEQAKLREEIKRSKKPSKEQVQALKKVDQQLKQTTLDTQKFRNELNQLGIAQAKLSKQRNITGRQQKQLGGAVQARQARTAGGAGPDVSGFKGVAAAVGPAVALLGAATVAARGFTAALTGVVETGARMESLRARLKTVTGGVDQAAEAFGLLRSFAATTPFELEDVTNAYVRLKSLGLKPTEESLKSFGNIAAAQGKPLIEFVEAVGDAATGEFERLKEFGIKASSQGENVAFTFAGMTTTVGKNAKEIQAFLQGLGENQFAGAMQDQMNTFSGILSNLKDTWTSFLDQIAQLGVLDAAKQVVAELSGVMGDDLAETIAGILVGALEMLLGLIQLLKGDGDGIGKTFKSVVSILQLLANVVKAVFIAFFPFSLFLKELSPLLLMIFNLIGSVAGVINDLATALVNLVGIALQPLKDLWKLLEDLVFMLSDFASKWDALGDTWSKVKRFGDGIQGTISGITSALFAQADAISEVRGEAEKLSKSSDFSKLSNKELQDLRRSGGESAKLADKEIRSRVAQQESLEKQQASTDKKKGKKKAASDRIKQFGANIKEATDRELASFASDPTVPEKLRKKAEKEQKSREKKKRKKGAASGAKASKQLRDATLVADIEKQIEKNARTIAQAETARAFRARKITAAEAGAFETERFKARKEKMTKRFEQTGELPAGIAQDIRQIAAIPSINNLAGRTQAPVISNTINKFDFRIGDLVTEVTGQFAQNPLQVAEIASVAFQRTLQNLLAESIPSFVTNERR